MTTSAKVTILFDFEENLEGHSDTYFEDKEKSFLESKCDYVAIACGYTERVNISSLEGCIYSKESKTTPKNKEIKKLIDLTINSTDDQNMHFALKKESLIYNKKPDLVALRTIGCDDNDEEDDDEGHCACFWAGSMSKVYKIEINNKTILLISYDTESG